MKLKYVSPTMDVVLIEMEDGIVKSSVLPVNNNGVVEQQWEEMETEYRTIDLNEF